MRDTTLTPVLIAGLPQLTGDLVAALLDRQPRADIHRLSGAGADLMAEIQRLGIRMLIVGNERLEDAHAAVEIQPVIKVLVVTADGSDGEVHELVPVRRRLGEISAGTLERALREAAAPWPPVWNSVFRIPGAER